MQLAFTNKFRMIRLTSTIAIINAYFRNFHFIELSIKFCNRNVCGHFIGTRVRTITSGARAQEGQPSDRGNALPLTCRTCSTRYYNQRESERDTLTIYNERERDIT